MPATAASSTTWTPARRELALAGVLGAVVLTASLIHGLTRPEALGAAALCLPLVWRTRSPLGTLAAVTAAAVAYLLWAEPSPVFIPPLLVAVYTVSAHGGRRRTLILAVATVPLVGLIVVAFSPDDGASLGQSLELASQVGIALAIGEAVRSQRAFVGATRERAERARHEHELAARQRMDEERVRIARDVHDVVAHSLATISTQAAVGVHVGRQEPERAVEMLQTIKEVSVGALDDLRYALGVLRDASGEAPTGPAPSIQDLPDLVGTARSTGQAVVLRMEGSPAGLPSALQVAVYRIVQEGLTNVMRHAGGAQATVRVAVAAHEVEVEVTDDGAGAPAPSSDAGTRSGLIGMRERASALGGAFEAGRAPGGGFRVHAVMPFRDQPT